MPLLPRRYAPPPGEPPRQARQREARRERAPSTVPSCAHYGQAPLPAAAFMPAIRAAMSAADMSANDFRYPAPLKPLPLFCTAHAMPNAFYVLTPRADIMLAVFVCRYVYYFSLMSAACFSHHTRESSAFVLPSRHFADYFHRLRRLRLRFFHSCHVTSFHFRLQRIRCPRHAADLSPPPR